VVVDDEELSGDSLDRLFKCAIIIADYCCSFQVLLFNPTEIQHSSKS